MGNVVPFWTDFVRVNTPMASIIENAQRWRPQIDFFNQENVGIFNPKDETGDGALRVAQFQVLRVSLDF